MKRSFKKPPPSTSSTTTEKNPCPDSVTTPTRPSGTCTARPTISFPSGCTASPVVAAWRTTSGMSRVRGASRVAVRVHPGTHPHRRPMARLQLPKRLDEGGGHQNCLRCRRRFSGTIPCKKHINPRTRRSAQPLDVDVDSLAPPCPSRSGGWRCACGRSGRTHEALRGELYSPSLTDLERVSSP